MKKYKYIKIGIASPEEIISWANPYLQGKKFKYNPLKKDRVTLLDENGKYEKLALIATGTISNTTISTAKEMVKTARGE